MIRFATESIPAYTLPGTMVPLTSSTSIVRAGPSNSSDARASTSVGMRSTRARSLPRPAGTMPSRPPDATAAPATSRTSPSPPTATTTSPLAAAAVASSIACSRLRVSSTLTLAPAVRMRSASGSQCIAARPPPEIGLTSAVKERMSTRSADQDAGVEDPGRVEGVLDRSQHLDGQWPDLLGVGVPVVGADAVVVGDGRAGLPDGGARGELGRVPLGDRVVALGAQNRVV